MQALQTGPILRPSHGIWEGQEGQGLGVLLLWLVLWQTGPYTCEFFPEAGSGDPVTTSEPEDSWQVQ